MKTYIYLTTQTSATDSMLRIFSRIGGFSFKEAKYIDKFLANHKPKDLLNQELPCDGGLHRFNLPPYFRVEKVSKNHKLFINYRDPRDHFCNVYHWQFNHPMPTLTEEERKAKIRKIEEIGIDKFVLDNADPGYYQNIMEALDTLPNEQFEVLTYARLCLDFDSFLSKCASFFDKELNAEIFKDLEIERINNLDKNSDYIGNRFSGSDVCPGRYRRELKETTIKELNKRFQSVLETMARFDPDFNDTYRF